MFNSICLARKKMDLPFESLTEPGEEKHYCSNVWCRCKNLSTVAIFPPFFLLWTFLSLLLLFFPQSSSSLRRWQTWCRKPCLTSWSTGLMGGEDPGLFHAPLHIYQWFYAVPLPNALQCVWLLAKGRYVPYRSHSWPARDSRLHHWQAAAKVQKKKLACSSFHLQLSLGCGN